MSINKNPGQAEIDLKQFASLIDTCLTSDNEALKNALRSLLVLGTIVTAESPSNEMAKGPLRRLISDVERLQHHVSQLESTIIKMQDVMYDRHRPSYYDMNNSWGKPTL